MKKIINIGNDFSTKLSRPIVADDTYSYEIVFTAQEDISKCFFNVVATRADGEKVADSVLVESGCVARYTLAGSMYSIPGTLKIRTTVVGKEGGKTSTLTTNEIICRVIEKTGEGSVDAETDVSVVAAIQAKVGELNGSVGELKGNVSKLQEDVSSIDEKDSTVLSNAKKYTDEEVTEAKGVAKQYTDEKTFAVERDTKTYTDEKTSKALSDAKKYADEASFESEQNSNNYTDEKTGDLVVKHYFVETEYPVLGGEKIITFDGMRGVEEIRFIFEGDSVAKVCMSDGINRSEWFVFPEAKGGVRNSLLISRSKDNHCTVEYTTNEGNNRYHPVLPDGFLESMKTATEVIYYGEDLDSYVTRVFYNTNVTEYVKNAKNAANEYTDKTANTTEKNAKAYADAKKLEASADATEKANEAEKNAKAYAASKADTAEAIAKTYAAVKKAEAISEASVDATKKASTAEENAKAYADEIANSAEQNAKEYSDEKTKNVLDSIQSAQGLEECVYAYTLLASEYKFETSNIFSASIMGTRIVLEIVETPFRADENEHIVGFYNNQTQTYDTAHYVAGSSRFNGTYTEIDIEIRDGDTFSLEGELHEKYSYWTEMVQAYTWQKKKTFLKDVDNAIQQAILESWEVGV